MSRQASGTAQDTRTRILAAAAAELADTGRVTVGGTARLAGLTRQTIHARFGGLEGLRAALVAEGLELPAPPPSDARELLVAAAIRVLSRPGAEASLEAIAREAGLTKGAIYHHFGDKAGLLRAVVARISPYEAFREALAATAGLSTREQLLLVARTYDRELGARADLIRGLLGRAQDDPELARLIGRELIGTIGALLIEWFRERTAAGALRPMHPAMALQVTVGPLVLKVLGRPMLEPLREAGLPFVTDDLEAYVDLLLEGLAAS